MIFGQEAAKSWRRSRWRSEGIQDGIKDAAGEDKPAEPAAAATPTPPPQQVTTGQTIEGEIREKTRG